MDGPKLKPASLETFADDDDDREPTKEEIMDDIRQGLRDVLAGYESQDAMESLEELRREIYGETDSR
ncbi:MAG: hypothetical protein OXI77_07675 [Chloroflexota bacterium]|nr:hypothetical protein [Chloroflexota bacterium]MDE2908356.1 hypothetical protein [Chloroflexota bacterium]